MRAFVKNPNVIVPLCENSSIQIRYQEFVATDELPGMVDKSLKAIAERITKEYEPKVISKKDDDLTLFE